MATMSDLPVDLVEKEILSRFPITSLRSLLLTCKEWKASARSQMFAKAVAEAKRQFLGFTVVNSVVCSFRFNLQGIVEEEEDDGDLVDDPIIKLVSNLSLVKAYHLFHCDGLLLCVTKEVSRIMVWNPFSGQTRWILVDDVDVAEDTYALGFDNHRNHKILRISDDRDSDYCGQRHEIYDFKSDSWKTLDASLDWDVNSHRDGAVSLKGNAYFLFREMLIEDEDEAEVTTEVYNFLLCFDFAEESFGPRLPLPSNSTVVESVVLSCVREDKLAVLYQRTSETIEIWTTSKVETSAVSWSKFLNVDVTPLNGFGTASFFIDEELKLAAVLDYNQTCYLVGEDGYIKNVRIGIDPSLGKPENYHHGHYSLPLACSCYVPSLVQLQINNRTIHCRKCGQAGHNSRTCRKRARARARQYYQASGSRASRMEAKTSQSQQPTPMEE